MSMISVFIFDLSPVRQMATTNRFSLSFQPPFEENGIASPIDKPKSSPMVNSLGSSIDSALVLSNTYPSKNRFLSGDQVEKPENPFSFVTVAPAKVS
jgi:hypothetical protein